MENKKNELTNSKKRGRYTLEELLRGVTDENRHEEMITDIQGKELI